MRWEAYHENSLRLFSGIVAKVGQLRVIWVTSICCNSSGGQDKKHCVNPQRFSAPSGCVGVGVSVCGCGRVCVRMWACLCAGVNMHTLAPCPPLHLALMAIPACFGSTCFQSSVKHHLLFYVLTWCSSTRSNLFLLWIHGVWSDSL